MEPIDPVEVLLRHLTNHFTFGHVCAHRGAPQGCEYLAKNNVIACIHSHGLNLPRRIKRERGFVLEGDKPAGA